MTIGKLSLSVFAALATAAWAANSTELTGNWQGTLAVPGRDLRLVIKVLKADNGVKGTLYSIDQGGPGVAASSLTVQPSGVVKIALPGIGAAFEGKLDPDGATIAGTYTQGPGSFPLILKRATPETAWAIPEPPPPPKRMAADANAVFEVATIKPSSDRPGKMVTIRGRHFITMNTTLSDLVTFSYGIHAKQIVNTPVWFDSDRFDLDAQPEAEGQPSEAQWKAMVKKLLADRFQLAFHRDKKELTAYAIVPGKSAPKLTKSEGDPNGLPGLFFQGPGILGVRNANIGDLAQTLQGAVLDRPVIDQSGLTGRWDFTLKWTPDEFQFGGAFKGQNLTDKPDAPPDLFTAIQQQLGLKIEGTKAPAEVLVIDKVEKPSAN